MDKNRLCAITDGIVAIAATIMVLELAIPDHVTISNLLGEWTIFISYVLSFSIIYMSWYAHQNLINNIDNYSGRLFLINGLWIFYFH